jgi:hypothetical protein
MKKPVLALTVATLVALPATLAAQGIGVGVRAGTLGFGAEAAVGLSSHLAIRAGMGVTPLVIKNPSFWHPGQDVNAKLRLPKTWYNIGVDLYPTGGSFRIGAGMLFKPDDPTLAGSLSSTGSIDIGGTTYTGAQVSEVTGTLHSKTKAPYVLIGFGRHTKSGIGLFLDLGVAFLGDPGLTFEATKGDPTVVNSALFQQSLRDEAATVQSKVGTYLKYWPIADIGIKLGLG